MSYDTIEFCIPKLTKKTAGESKIFTLRLKQGTNSPSTERRPTPCSVIDVK